MKITVEALLKLLEYGTKVTIYDNFNDTEMIYGIYWDSDTRHIFEPYFDQEVKAINTDCDDCDIEIVI